MVRLAAAASSADHRSTIYLGAASSGRYSRSHISLHLLVSGVSSSVNIGLALRLLPVRDNDTNLCDESKFGGVSPDRYTAAWLVRMDRRNSLDCENGTCPVT